MRGTGIEKEVEIFCYEHNQQNQVYEHQCKEMEKKLWRHVVSTTSAICGVKPEHSRLKRRVFYSLEYRMMEKVQKPSNFVCYTPSSEPCRIYLLLSVLYNEFPWIDRPRYELFQDVFVDHWYALCRIILCYKGFCTSSTLLCKFCKKSCNLVV
jgi:hypothetical protein